MHVCYKCVTSMLHMCHKHVSHVLKAALNNNGRTVALQWAQAQGVDVSHTCL